ncbi:type IV secretory system conjugative DNA transfer family protein [Afipia carboxidovorans]|jgi:hypothetical protein|uniref:type IV secretory system conjugative DNA transfer family protein n=1 Tax=Afipia carboxidovorans TaxID=40137 RepID=UPI00308FEFA1|nr:hypothetical protein CRBSH125_22780 [Afipia carboxidovorans]
MTYRPEYEIRSKAPAVFCTLLFGMLFACIASGILLGALPWAGWRQDMPVTLTGLEILRFAAWRWDSILWAIDVHNLQYPLLARGAAIAVGSLGAGVSAGWIAWNATPFVDTRRHYEGIRRLKGKAAVAAANHAMEKEIADSGRAYEFAPGVWFSQLRSLVNVLIIGAPGSGKTRIVLFLIEQILDGFGSLRNKSQGLLAHDTTGEIRRGFPRDHSHIASVGLEGKDVWAWAIGEDVLTADDADEVARRLLGERHGAKHSNSVFDAGGSTILAGCIVICQKTHGRKWGAQELLEIVSLDAARLRAKLVEVDSPAAALLDMDEDGRSLSKTSASFMLTYRAHVLRVLEPLARHWRDVSPNRHFSFVSWMNGDHKQPRIVLLQRSARLSELSAAWIGAAIDLIAAYATDAAFNPDKKRRLHLVLDEFHQLGPLGRFQELLDVGRNKNVSVIATLQDLNQLRLNYNEAGAKNMIERFATVIIGKMRQGEASTNVSEQLIGKRTILDRPDKSQVPDATSTQKREVPLVRPEQLSQELGVFDHKVHALVTGFGDVLELNWPVTVWPERQS